MASTSAKSDETIFDIARSCLDLFKSYLSENRPSSLRIATEQQRFWAWSNTLKVFAKPHICLDAQLRGEKYDQIRRMVSLLLGVLRQNLSLALESVHIVGSSREIPPGLDQPTETHKQLDGDPLDVAFFGIAGSVKRLERIAAVILQATQGSLARRISAYAEKCRAKEIEQSVENSIVDHIAGVMRHRFRDISPPLSQQLLNSFLYRHYRILYGRSHGDPEFSRLQAPQPATEPISQSHVVDAEISGPTLIIGARLKVEEKSNLDEETQSEQTRPLTIDEKLVREKLAEDSSVQPQPPSPPSVSETGAPLYPNPPYIPDGQKEGRCPICLKMFPAEEFEWHQWKLHVDKDVQPFVCISEDCSKNLQFFENRQLWMNHMKKTHTSLWIKFLHNNVLWKCTLCGSKVPKYYESEKELFKHMEISHNDIEESERQNISRNSGVPQPRSINICPICGDSHLPQQRHAEESDDIAEETVLPPSSKETGVRKKKARVQFATPDDIPKDTENSEPRKNTAPQLSQEMKDHNRIEKYLGKHLQALAYYFTNRLIEDEEGEQNLSEGRNADASSSGLDGLPAIENYSTLPRFEHEEDPPKLPSPNPEDSLLTSDEVDLIAKNRLELLETWEWNDQGRVPEPGFESGYLEQLFPDMYRQDSSVIWKGLMPLEAFELAAVILLGMNLCNQMVSAVLAQKHNEVPVPQKLNSVIEDFVVAIEGILEISSTPASSDYVVAILNLAVESHNTAKELSVLTSGPLAKNKLEDLDDHALELIGNHTGRVTESLQFKLELARINSKKEAHPISEENIKNASSTEFGSATGAIFTSIALGDSSFLEVVKKQAKFLIEGPPKVPARTYHVSLADRIVEHCEQDVFNVPARDFLPQDCMAKLVTRDAIIEEFNDEEDSILDLTKEEDNNLLAYILERSRKVFATAIICEISDRPLYKLMKKFESNGIQDESLPLSKEVLLSSWSTGKYWSNLKFNRYLDKQFIFLAPVFTKSFLKLDLEPKYILPFIWVSDEVKEGAFSTVRQVKIHNAHNQFMTDGQNDIVAIKEIKTYSSIQDQEQVNREWEVEVETFHNMNSLNHRHITLPIAAITTGNRRYLIHPWTDGGTVREFWENTPRPRIDSNFVEEIVRQLRGLADALDVLHNREGASYRHGNLKPENILVFKDNTRVGTLKIADMGLCSRHKVQTRLRARTSTQICTSRYEPPEVITQRMQGRSRLYDIWSIGCITLELLVWLLYGYSEVKDFKNSLIDDSVDEMGTFFLVDREILESADVHPRVRACMDYISKDPECSGGTAMSDLLEIVREKLLVVRLPEQRSESLATNVEEYGGSVGVSITAPENLVSPAKLGPPGSFRATARDFRDSLDDIIRKGELNERYWFSGKPRPLSLGGPASNPFKVNQSYLSPTTAFQPNPLIVRQIPQKSLEFEEEPINRSDLKYLWEFPVDNEFPSSIAKDLLTSTFYPHTKNPRLCSKCAKLDFWDPLFSMQDTPLELEKDSTTCEFCKMRWNVSKHLKIEDSPILRLEKSGSVLRMNNTPALSLCRRPDLEPQTSIRAQIQIGLPVLPEAGSDPHFEILRRWLAHCDHNHPSCLPSVRTPRPTRLLDAGDSYLSPVRLYETTSSDSMPFVALSYIWGLYPPFKATTSNIDEMKNSIGWNNLPATFQHAVIITRALGFRYLWIDSICIIQDSKQDWSEEAAKMEDVFSSASFVLNLSSSKSQGDGIFKERDPREYLAFDQDAQSTIYVCQFIDNYDEYVLKSPLNKRGWVLQERILARRTIYFTDKQTFWECGGGVRCETLTKMNNNLASLIADPSFPQLAMRSSRDGKTIIYQDLYSHYSRLQFAHIVDRPVAIAGLEKRLIGAFETRGGFGTFDDGRAMFHKSLLWRRGSDERSLKKIEFSAAQKVPTWSWMAYEGGIDYLELPPNGMKWQQNELQSPWHRGSLGEISALPIGENSKYKINAIARNFNQGREDSGLIYDIAENFDGSSADVKCVVLGHTSTGNAPEDENDMMYFVLLVAPSITDTRRGVYERVGVGRMPGRSVDLIQNGDVVKIY